MITQRAGSAASVIGMAWGGFATSGPLYMCAMPINALSGLAVPGLQGLMTRLVGPREQGQLQGANQSLMGIASVIGPLLFGLSFAWAVRHPVFQIPGRPLLSSSLIMAGCLALALWAARDAARRSMR